MGLGGALGMVTAAWQTVERIALASDPGAPSVCEINAVISCSSVYSHWQSSALGIPNSLIALPVFAIIAATGLAGVLGSSLSSRFVAGVFGLTVFMTAFVTWYLEQSALSIGVLCLFCIDCAATILLAGVGVTRVAAGLGALGSGRVGRGVGAMVAAGADLVAWAGLALLLAVMLALGLML
jgi:uncharacterized membrane protein